MLFFICFFVVVVFLVTLASWFHLEIKYIWFRKKPSNEARGWGASWALYQLISNSHYAMMEEEGLLFFHSSFEEDGGATVYWTHDYGEFSFQVTPFGGVKFLGEQTWEWSDRWEDGDCCYYPWHQDSWDRIVSWDWSAW